jgi:hypothetical protein
MNIHSQPKPLTLGEFVTRVYDKYEARRAAVIVWRAMRTQQVVLQEQGAQVSMNSLKKRARI